MVTKAGTAAAEPPLPAAAEAVPAFGLQPCCGADLSLTLNDGKDMA
jgi:hypothetical protein